jgi:hypothetical protein
VTAATSPAGGGVVQVFRVVHIALG